MFDFPAALCGVGYGGFSIEKDTSSNPRIASSHASGYGPEMFDNLPADVPLVDVTRDADGRRYGSARDTIITLSCSGPMPDPAVPAGMLNKFVGGTVAWDPTPDLTRNRSCAFLGNAHGLDRCGIDVKLTLARIAGAWVGTVGEWLAQFDTRPALAAA